ncbi:MAG: GIY-YIG nuclease family protein [Nitrososphaera sp.]
MRKHLTSAIPGYVYRIYRVADGKSYVGSTVDIKKRKRTHFSMLRRSVHHCIHLQRAWNTYGESAFAFEILEELFISSDAELRAAEDAYFIQFDLYNTSPVAESPLGVVHSEETRQKRSRALRGRQLSDEHKAKIGRASSGRRHTEASRKKLSERAKQRDMSRLRAGWAQNIDRIRDLTRKQNAQRPPPSEESLRMRAISLHGHDEGFLFVSIVTGEQVRVWNMAAFARARGLNKNGLSAVITGRQKSHYGWMLAPEEGL